MLKIRQHLLLCYLEIIVLLNFIEFVKVCYGIWAEFAAEKWKLCLLYGHLCVGVCTVIAGSRIADKTGSFIAARLIQTNRSGTQLSLFYYQSVTIFVHNSITTALWYIFSLIS